MFLIEKIATGHNSLVDTQLQQDEDFEEKLTKSLKMSLMFSKESHLN
jgi:hypothetical protein